MYQHHPVLVNASHMHVQFKRKIRRQNKALDLETDPKATDRQIAEKSSRAVTRRSRGYLQKNIHTEKKPLMFKCCIGHFRPRRLLAFSYTT